MRRIAIVMVAALAAAAPADAQLAQPAEMIWRSAAVPPPMRERLLAVAPTHFEADFERARRQSRAAWSRELESEYERTLATAPDDVAALLGLADQRAAAGMEADAVELYDRALAVEPRNMRALRGRARAAAWGGGLARAERRWREALVVAPADAESLFGLAQTLHWQGRHAAAQEVAQRALSHNPANAAARELLMEIEASQRPHAGPGVSYAGDSRRNVIGTAGATAGVRLDPRLELRGSGYVRRAREEIAGIGLQRRAYGGSIGAAAELDPGWMLAAAVGASTSNVVGAPVFRTIAASLRTPSRHRLAGELTLRRAPSEANARAIEREVLVRELDATVSTMLPGALRLRGRAGVARFDGRLSGLRNARIGGGLAIDRPVSPALTLALQTAAFGFDGEHGGDGYFSPDFYGLAEIAAHWQRQREAWAFGMELAPGVQQLRPDGGVGASVRGAAGAHYTLRPGRSIGATAHFANSALHALAPIGSESSYRTYELSIATRWDF